MTNGLIFWRQPLRVAGPRPAHEAIHRLREFIEARRFSVGPRLAGKLEGPGSAPHLRVWRKGALSAAGDVVEFDGTLRSEGDGTAIEGSVAYTVGSRVQFVGLIAIGVAITLIGALQRSGATPAEDGMLQFGLLLTGIAALWIFASSRMRHEQVHFIEAHLAECVGASPPKDAHGK